MFGGGTSRLAAELNHSERHRHKIQKQIVGEQLSERAWPMLPSGSGVAIAGKSTENKFEELRPANKKRKRKSTVTPAKIVRTNTSNFRQLVQQCKSP
jgi:hypothetical protein